MGLTVLAVVGGEKRGGEEKTAIILLDLLNLSQVMFEIFRESAMWVDQERSTEASQRVL